LYKKKERNYDRRIVKKMTLEEKIGQLNQVTPSIVGGFDLSFSELIEMVSDGRISQEEFGKIMSESKKIFMRKKSEKGKLDHS
jgi:beta-glucosidase